MINDESVIYSIALLYVKKIYSRSLLLYHIPSLTTIHFPVFCLFQEIKHVKQMRGNEAGAAEIKTQGEC